MCDDVLLLGVVFVFNQFRVVAVCRRLFALVRAHVDWVLQLGARFWHLFIVDSILLFVSLGGVPYLLMLLLLLLLLQCLLLLDGRSARLREISGTILIYGDIYYVLTVINQKQIRIT